MKRNKKINIMKPGHPRWNEFLSHAKDLSSVDPQTPPVEGHINCDGTLRNTWRLLEAFPGVDVVHSIEYLYYRRVMCDCELHRLARFCIEEGGDFEMYTEILVEYKKMFVVSNASHQFRAPLRPLES